MEVILLANIDDLGTVGQTVKVKDGYARNYLLPRKLACPATQKNLNLYRTRIEAEQKKLAKAKEAAEQLAGRMAEVTLTFVKRSREDDTRLFGSVTTAEIAEALQQKGYELDRKRIAMSEPIKRLGEYKVTVRLHPQVATEINVLVKAENEA